MKQDIMYRAMLGVVLGALVMAGAWAQAEDKIEGEVRSVDSETGMLTLSDGKQLAIDPGTQVRKDGSIASLSDIKEGDQVQASFLPSIARLLGQQEALQNSVRQVVATSRTGEARSIDLGGDAM
jgi:Cu/Ag efflux protein CusF